jgi:hypothetical protein
MQRFNYSLPLMQHATHTHEYRRSLSKHLHLNYDLRIKTAEMGRLRSTTDSYVLLTVYLDLIV